MEDWYFDWLTKYGLDYKKRAEKFPAYEAYRGFEGCLEVLNDHLPAELREVARVVVLRGIAGRFSANLKQYADQWRGKRAGDAAEVLPINTRSKDNPDPKDYSADNRVVYGRALLKAKNKRVHLANGIWRDDMPIPFKGKIKGEKSNGSWKLATLESKWIPSIFGDCADPVRFAFSKGQYVAVLSSLSSFKRFFRGTQVEHYKLPPTLIDADYANVCQEQGDGMTAPLSKSEGELREALDKMDVVIAVTTGEDRLRLLQVRARIESQLQESATYRVAL